MSRAPSAGRTLVPTAAALLLAACGDVDRTPTAVPQVAASDHALHSAQSTVSTAALEPFTFRAPLDPYRIHQLPDFLMHSKERTDIVIQRNVFAPGPGPWHTHPGPSFVYVIQGAIKLQHATAKGACTETQVFTPGSAYAEVGNEVHRAVVVSSESAVLLVTRFNIPIGAPLSTPAPDPGC